MKRNRFSVLSPDQISRFLPMILHFMQELDKLAGESELRKLDKPYWIETLIRPCHDGEGSHFMIGYGMPFHIKCNLHWQANEDRDDVIASERAYVYRRDKRGGDWYVEGWDIPTSGGRKRVATELVKAILAKLVEEAKAGSFIAPE